MKVVYDQINPHSCKTYRVGIEGSREIVLIDPVIDHVNDYAAMVRDNNLTLAMVIDTHTHADHISGGPSLKDMLDCEYSMHVDSPVKCASIKLKDGDRFDLFGQVPVEVIHTPGHTRDSVSLVFPEWIFTGDALFLDDGGAGRDDLPGGDPGRHWETLRRFWDLSEDLLVLPAHDYRNREPSSLGRQKQTNPHLKMSRESREAYVEYLEDLKLGAADWMKDVLKANYACARDPGAAWIPVDAPSCEVKGTMDKTANEVEVVPVRPDDVRKWLASADPPVLLDVREEDELPGPLGHIEGIVHIPIASLSHRLGELEKYKDRMIVTVCRSGSRAYTAAQILTVAGFKQVAVLDGGMQAWRATDSN